MRYSYVVGALLLLGGGAAAVTWIKGDAAKQADAQSSRGGGGKRGSQNGAVPVSVATVKKQTVPVYRDGIGNVQALFAVTARAQVDGKLLSVEFTEGQDVKKGDVLARIDPAFYKALYEQALAKKAQDEATLGSAKLDLERYTHLAQSNAGTKQQADQQAATVAQLVAQISSDQAAIDNAKATLDFTTIVSPLDGRVGLRLVDPGNIVHASDQTGIVSIAQLKPIAVVFTLPQRELAVTAAAFARGPVQVEIPGDNGKPIATGKLMSLDNQIDITTGTIKLKAQFDNEKLTLWPGQFVAARVVVDMLTDAKVVASSAVRRGTAGTYVYTVSADSTAVVTPVVVALQDDAIAVLSSGVDFDQKIVTEGFSQLSDGKAIQISGGDPAGEAGKAKKPGDKTAASPDQAPANGVVTPALASEAGTGDKNGTKRERRHRDGGKAGGIETGSAPAAEGTMTAEGQAAGSPAPQGKPGARP